MQQTTYVGIKQLFSHLNNHIGRPVYVDYWTPYNQKILIM